MLPGEVKVRFFGGHAEQEIDVPGTRKPIGGKVGIHPIQDSYRSRD